MTVVADSTNQEQMRLLDTFLVDNEELESLSARLESFNLFNVLQVARTEIRHSNVLAWLLTPNATHGLGTNFLRRFLSRLLMENDVPGVDLTPAEVELMDFGDVEVLREWKHIDVVVRAKTNNWCLLIENKIDAKESRGQLIRYVDAVRQDMPTARVIPVFLTVEGDDPSEDGQDAGFLALSHAQVLDVAERIIAQHRARIPRDVAVFLDHYLNTLRRITMQDEQLADLCKTIYRKHREAIDLIVEYGSSSGVLGVCADVMPELVKCEFVEQSRGRVWYLPDTMSKQDLGDISAWPFFRRTVAVVCWLYYFRKKGVIQASMEVGPISDLATRQRLLHAMEDAGFSFQEKGYREGAKYTRILTKRQKLNANGNGDPDETPESVEAIVRSLWKTFWKKGSDVVEVLNSFDWNSRG